MKTPTIENIADIRTSAKTPRMVHFTMKQWNESIKGIPVEDYDKKLHSDLDGITGYTNPDEVIIYPSCGESPGPGELCGMFQTFKPGKELEGSGIGPQGRSIPGGELHFECRCRPKPGGGGHVKPPKQECHFAIIDGRLQCVGHCDAGCNIRIVQQEFSNGRSFILISCTCGAV